MELLPEDFSFDGKKVFFVHADGTPATHAVGTYGTDKDGNLMFFEIVNDQIVRPKINGKNKYCRIVVQRVFPCLPCDEEIIKK